MSISNHMSLIMENLPNIMDQHYQKGKIGGMTNKLINLQKFPGTY